MSNEKNHNEEFDSLEYAKTALDIMRRGGTDEETARGLLEVANTSALVSIADSLRVIAYEIVDGVTLNAEIELTRGGEGND